MLLSAFSFGSFAAQASTLKSGNYEYKIRDDGNVTIYRYIGNEYEVVIPEEIDGHTVTKIAHDAFAEPYYPYLTYSASSLIRTVTIPKTITKIEWTNFYELPYLNNIFVDEENANYSSERGVLFNKDKSTLLIYPSARLDETYKIPTSVKKINYRAFYNSKYLNHVTITENVKTIKIGAFLNCFNIEDIYIPKTVKKIENCALGCKKIYYSCWYDPKNLSSEDLDSWDPSENFEYVIAPDKSFIVYGEKGSEAEKYCKRSPKFFDEDRKGKIKFKAFTVNKPKFTAKGKKGKLTYTVSGNSHLCEYTLKITKNKKTWKQSYGISDNYSEKSKTTNTIAMKKGTYKIKVKCTLYVGGTVLTTPWSKTVKVKVK